ncbi:hypothetical protein E4T56_gene10079 [Termitomyces sp. T112]|nr:hypothetical protein E4T56_gene10079 [Termitomyces sp. T112]
MEKGSKNPPALPPHSDKDNSPVPPALSNKRQKTDIYTGTANPTSLPSQDPSFMPSLRHQNPPTTLIPQYPVPAPFPASLSVQQSNLSEYIRTAVDSSGYSYQMYQKDGLSFRLPPGTSLQPPPAHTRRDKYGTPTLPTLPPRIVNADPSISESFQTKWTPLSASEWQTLNSNAKSLQGAQAYASMNPAQKVLFDTVSNPTSSHTSLQAAIALSNAFSQPVLCPPTESSVPDSMHASSAILDSDLHGELSASTSASSTDQQVADPSPQKSKTNTRQSEFYQQVVPTQLSPLTPAIKWRNGCTTALPFISNPKAHKKNLLASDAAAVRRLADLPPSTESPLVVHLEYNDSLTDLASICRAHLSLGKTIVISGYPTEQFSDIQSYLSTTGLDLQNKVHTLHDMTRRQKNVTYPHYEGTVQELLDNLTNPRKIQCILSLQIPYPPIPALIGNIDHGYAQGYIRNQDVAHYVNGGKKVHFSADIEHTRSWALLHHGGVHTYEHHDAEGQGTFVQIPCGAKMWSIVRPAGFEQAKTPEGLTTLAEQMVNPGTKKARTRLAYEEKAEGCVVNCQPGDFMIMPPGAYHMVYTPIPTAAIGGHYLSYNTMHLTEASRYFDHLHGHSITNNVHDTTYITICGMMISVYRGLDIVIQTKCLQALCRMVMVLEDYYPAMDDDDHLQTIHQLEDTVLCKLAKHLAEDLASAMEWDLKTRHFLFEGSGTWMDPGYPHHARPAVALRPAPPPPCTPPPAPPQQGITLTKPRRSGRV